ncbi:conserved hypothetical protein (plasmid) [Nitrobacter hamburgensis X14]|uniref:Uncharacterized protein n=1 Tax=Nitrobacter hamburgensis (strain DSM 10229 / NCIMB 13809 / X14) TaxID=323097 RepID=Q1QFR0_NITHX|nr:hypothetical protein [Nitrobacter hamburgensis]ABE64937.1 conserved hypothetical protein [Nitrobacter hamburgensis X14]
MTSIKDKLASSVRQAKTAAEPAPADKAAAHKTPPSAATATKAAEPAPADSLAAEPPSSVQELFPDRIWPD